MRFEKSGGISRKVKTISIITILIFFVSEQLRTSLIGDFASALDSAKIKYMFLLLTVAIVSVNGKNPLSIRYFYPESKYFYSSFVTILVITILYQITNGFLPLSITELQYISGIVV